MRARRVSDREKRDPAVSEKKEREGEAGWCGAACALELGRALASSWARGERKGLGLRPRKQRRKLFSFFFFFSFFSFILNHFQINLKQF